MTSAQSGLASTRLPDEPNIPATAHDLLAERSSHFAEISARLGGRFSADLEEILGACASRPDETPNISRQARSERATCNERHYALACLRSGNVLGAIDFIQRHAPEQIAWLNEQVKFIQAHSSTNFKLPAVPKRSDFLLVNSDVPNPVMIDAEAGRIARVLGQFGIFRAWAYAQAADDGDGWIDRQELEAVWQQVNIAESSRHIRRIIREGVEGGYWTHDKERKRIYLTGQVNLAVHLVRKAMQAGCNDIIQTNLPGRRRISVDLSGSLQEASARLYAAWLISKDPQGKGTIISRETLCSLWRVSTPTLLTWESIAGIESHANYAQQNETAIHLVPSYAYLTCNRDGSYAAAWRLPNTYTVSTNSIQPYFRIGKAKKVRRAVCYEIAHLEQRGSIGEAALPRSGKRYFTEKAGSSFHVCEKYLRKVGRNDGDLSYRRYFYTGRRHGTHIYEPYNLHSNLPETDIHQRLIWQEYQIDFVALRSNYRRMVSNCCEGKRTGI